MVSQKYRAGPVFNLGGALNGIFFMAGIGDCSLLLRCFLVFRQAPIARIFIFIEAGIFNV